MTTLSTNVASRGLRGLLPSAAGAVRSAIPGGRQPARDDESRWARWKELDRLDPVKDHPRINEIFMKDFEAALSWSGFEGLLITYAIPSMSRILVQGELLTDPSKRMVDTAILQDKMYAEGFGPGDGRDAIRRMNQMHQMYPILAEDFTFISCSEAVHKIRSAERYGWREVHPKERQAMVEFALERARYMNVSNVPKTWDEMAVHYDRYIEENAEFEPQNKMLTDVFVKWTLDRVPPLMRPFAKTWLLISTDPTILRAVQLPVPSALTTRLMGALWKKIVELKGPGDKGGAPADDFVAEFYPDGYKVTELGTFTPGKCPFPHPEPHTAQVATAE